MKFPSPNEVPVIQRSSRHPKKLLSPKEVLVTQRSSCHLKKFLSPKEVPVTQRSSCHLKKFLGGKRSDDDDDQKDAVQKWLTSQAATFYEEGTQKHVPRYDKCLNNGGRICGKNSSRNVESDNNKILY